MAFKTSAFATARLLRAVCILSILSPLLMVAAVKAQQPAPVAAPQAANASKSVNLAAKPDIRPFWTELTPMQQQALGPLAPEWNKLDSNHKSKWLAISNKFATMTPEQQKRLQDNIRDWVNMTPEQHRLARESYARTKKLNAEQKNAQWQQYQQLPEEQKQKLADDAKAKKRIANVPSLQNKRKPVEPLTSSKKPVANRNGVQPANPALPPVGATPTVVAPAASANVSTPTAPSASAAAATPTLPSAPTASKP